MASEESEEEEAAECGARVSIVLVLIVVVRGQQQVQEKAYNIRRPNVEGGLPISRGGDEDTRDKHHERLAHCWRSYIRIAASPRHERKECGELLRYVVDGWAH